MDKTRSANRLPKLGKLSMAVIEHLVQPVIGDRAISEIKAPLVEKELRDSLAKALVDTEGRFVAEYTDAEVKEAVLNLPLANLPKVLQAVRDFYTRPTDNTLRQILHDQITTTFRCFPPEHIDSGVLTYLRILREELANLSSEIRGKLDTHAILSIEDNTMQIAKTLNRIEYRLSAKQGKKRSGPKSNLDLDLVDVSFAEEGGYDDYDDYDYDDTPVLDIKLRNIGKRVIFLKRVTFSVQKIWRIRPLLKAMGAVKSSAKYDIMLPASNIPYSKSVNISNAIPPNDVDRFMISMDAERDTIYQIAINIIYDGDDKSIRSENILFFTPKPTSIYTLPRYSRNSEEIESLNKFDWIFDNKKVLEDVSKIKAVKNRGLRDIERFILKSLRYFDSILETYRRRLLALTDGNTSHINEIEYLLNPELGIEFEGSCLRFSEMTDGQLIYLRCLAKLEELDLGFSSITNTGLICLQNLDNLRKLTIGGAGINGAGLIHLSKFKRLTSLDLSGMPKIGKGLESLKALRNLEILKLAGTSIGNLGLVHLRELENLKILDLTDSKITDQGLKKLQEMTKLEELRIEGCQITDVGLTYLQELENLKVLDLANTKITDQGLKKLQGMTNLRELKIVGCQITDVGLTYLKSLKKLKIQSRGYW